MTKNHFITCNDDCHLLRIPLPEFRTKWLKRPNFVKLSKREKKLFSGPVTYINDGEIHAVINLKMTSSLEEEKLLLNAFLIKSLPFTITFYHKYLKTQCSSLVEKKILTLKWPGGMKSALHRFVTELQLYCYKNFIIWVLLL